MRIAKIAQTDVTDLRWTLQENPHLWDQNRARTESPGSPHHGLSDIWARYAKPGEDGSKPHESVWYPSPVSEQLEAMADELCRSLKGEELGGVLVTRIPPRAICKPHRDPGWHARYYEKVAVQVTSAPGQKFCFETQGLVTRPGDVFWFDNDHVHWVENESPYERITAIFCIKTSVFDHMKEKP